MTCNNKECFCTGKCRENTVMGKYEFWPSNQGWQCPVCKAVYAPTTPMCFKCSGNTTISYQAGETA